MVIITICASTTRAAGVLASNISSVCPIPMVIATGLPCTQSHLMAACAETPSNYLLIDLLASSVAITASGHPPRTQVICENDLFHMAANIAGFHMSKINMSITEMKDE